MFVERSKVASGALVALALTAVLAPAAHAQDVTAPLAITSAAAAVPVPVPHFEGPVPARGAPGADVTHDYPQLTAEPYVDLASAGYTEEEFFFGGQATRYDTPALADGVALSGGHPYESRVIVRRPVDPAKFNGKVIVEWVNVTSGYGTDLHWQYSHDHLTREGYVYVGVQAQRVGIHQEPYGLKAWSPQRYAALDLTDGGTITDDSLSYDVFSQVGEALKTGGASSVLPGFRAPDLVLAAGQSQSANRLTSYYNSIQPLHQVYDGFLLQVQGAGATFRTDVPAKLIRVNSENEIVRGQAGSRQPDSDTFRGWEVAGAAHVDYWWAMQRHALAARDGIATPDYTCTPEPLSHVPLGYVLNAGYHALEQWIQAGVPAPHAEPIRVDSIAPVVIPRDADGLVYGGIRQAEVDVPTATNSGANEQANNPCNLYGSHVPFSQGKINALYPTHEDYVREVTEVTLRNVDAGFTLPDDAREIIAEAVASPVGTGRPLPIP